MLKRLERLRRRRTAVAAAAVVAALVAVVVAAVAMGGGGGSETVAPVPTATSAATATPSNTPTTTPEASPTPIKHAGILDGVPMTDDEWDERKDQLPLAVMVDNTASSVPHAGLNRADLVYEAFVEGGITRLMAVYWRQDAEKIVPVRSARTPFVNWVSELGAMYGHAGGAVTDNEANAVGQIFEYGIRDLNAFSPVSSNYYYREHDRNEPYNLATSTDYLREAAEQLGYAGPPAVTPWVFREPGATLPPGAPAGGLEIDYSGRLYAWQYIQWKWDATAKRYLRFQFGGPEVDAETGEQLAFSTVVVMRVPSHVVDESGHVILDQFGEGPATVFTGGQAYEGAWKKDSRTAHTSFVTARGEAIVFERGPIFIQVIGTESTFDYVAKPDELRTLPEYEPPPPGVFPEPGDETPPPPTDTPTAVVTPTPRVTRTVAPSATSPASPAPSATGSPAASATLPVPAGTVSPVASASATASN